MRILSNRRRRSSRDAFTMAELALCIAVVAIAMVAIIGVLPLGMNVQKQNREETIINQDAQILMDALKTAAVSGAPLTNIYRDSLKLADRMWTFANQADDLLADRRVVPLPLLDAILRCESGGPLDSMWLVPNSAGLSAQALEQRTSLPCRSHSRPFIRWSGSITGPPLPMK